MPKVNFSSYLSDLNKYSGKKYTDLDILTAHGADYFDGVPEETLKKLNPATQPKAQANSDWIAPAAPTSLIDSFISKHPDRDPDAIREGYAQFQEDLTANG